jgi:hypothetical protein
VDESQRPLRHEFEITGAETDDANARTAHLYVEELGVASTGAALTSVVEGVEVANTSGPDELRPQLPKAGSIRTAALARMLCLTVLAELELIDCMSDSTALAALANGVVVRLVGATKR